MSWQVLFAPEDLYHFSQWQVLRAEGTGELPLPGRHTDCGDVIELKKV